jgi:hypothetical protein
MLMCSIHNNYIIRRRTQGWEHKVDEQQNEIFQKDKSILRKGIHFTHLIKKCLLGDVQSFSSFSFTFFVHPQIAIMELFQCFGS